jgi:hypothetical protein
VQSPFGSAWQHEWLSNREDPLQVSGDIVNTGRTGTKRPTTALQRRALGAASERQIVARQTAREGRWRRAWHGLIPSAVALSSRCPVRQSRRPSGTRNDLKIAPNRPRSSE